MPYLKIQTNLPLTKKAERVAAIGTSLRHSAHFFVVGSAGASPRCW